MSQLPPHKFSVLKWLGLLGISFFVIVVVSFSFKDEILRYVGIRTGSTALGARLEIGHFYWNVLTQKIVIKDLTIVHPPGFGEGRFIDIPQVVVQYDLGAILKGKMHMTLVSLDLKELNVIKNSEGKLNVDALKVLHPQKKEKFAMTEFEIDELKLNIGKVIYKDHYKKPVPQILVYDINLKNRTFKNIDNVPKLITVVLAQALKPTMIQSAGLYAATTLMGAAFLPAAVLGVIVTSDASVGELNVNAHKAFNGALAFVKKHGRLIKSDPRQGTIEANIQSVDIKIKVENISWFKSRMTVSGRKYMLAKKEFAAGILYQISEGL